MDPIKHTLDLDASPETAYRAVATPEGIRGWWCKDCDVTPEVGGTHELRFVKDGNPVTMKFRVDALDDGERVVWSCTDNANPIWVGSKLTWEVTARDGGSRIAFTHDGLTGGGPPYEMTAQGWKHFMGSLTAYASTGSGEPW